MLLDIVLQTHKLLYILGSLGAPQGNDNRFSNSKLELSVLNVVVGFTFLFYDPEERFLLKVVVNTLNDNLEIGSAPIFSFLAFDCQKTK